MVSKGSYRGTALSPAKAPGSGAKYNSNTAGGDGRPSGSGGGKTTKGSYPIDKTSKQEVGKGRGSSGSKGELGMFGREKSSPVSSKSKKFKSIGMAKKSFGFGKQQSQGMKGRPTQYGSA